ncbi:MAG: hypothetical protein SFY56_01820 [Bacteroidota bacterium]|nr:hypothetical protein [Bacteroidota bacterium]
MAKFLKIYLNVAISLVFYQYVMQYYEFDVKKIFKMYLNVSFFVCVLGLFQLVSYLVGFVYGYDFRILFPINKWGLSLGGLGVRINSVFSEPSYLGAYIAPAFFIAIYQVITRTSNFMSIKKSLVIIVCYLLSASSVGYLGVFLCVILLTLNYGAVRYFLIAIPLVVILFITAYNNTEEFKVRVDGINELFFQDIMDEKVYQGETSFGRLRRIKDFLKRVHGSSFVLYNNYNAAKQNFIENPFFGTGLGSHEFAFEKYNLASKIGNIYEFNVTDANSMFLRTVSEVGLIGVVFLIFFVIKFFVSRDLNMREIDDYWLISNALLVLILLQYARQGNYTYNGFFLYCWMYYYNKVAYSKYAETLNSGKK